MAKFQEIKSSNKGQFVTFNGRRHYLDTFPKFFNNETFTKGKNSIVAHGCKPMSNSSSLLIELSSCGEAAKLMLYY